MSNKKSVADIDLVKDKVTVALIGNPNCGKTTLFNALTGSRQRIGNWPGVTVERKSGSFITQCGTTVEIVDLPGVYSLNLADDAPMDEQVACDYLASGEVDVIVNIVDSNNLARHLYLTTQLLELKLPMVIAANMLDVAAAQGKEIDVKALSEQFDCLAVGVQASKKKGLRALKTTIIKSTQQRLVSRIQPNYGDTVEDAITNVSNLGFSGSGLPLRWFALRLLEDDSGARDSVDKDIYTKVQEQKNNSEKTLDEEIDIVIADARYEFIQSRLPKILRTKGKVSKSITAALDKVLLNRFLGVPIFLFVMYAMFVFAINIGGAFQDFFDISTDVVFVQGMSQWLFHLGVPAWIVAIFGVGIGKGINTTVTFIPVIGGMFLFLAFLERSGYMMRAAFVVDRLMRAMGLPGQSFVPMIVGFGCNVPAVMGTRTLSNRRDQILTAMMTPFMSCGARLAIFAVFASAFFPRGGALVIFLLYITGVMVAVLTGFILRKTVLSGESSPLVLELPAYHWPRVGVLLMDSWQRLKAFIMKAGKLIIPICIVISALNAVSFSGHWVENGHSSESALADVGRVVTPIFKPMGVRDDNWPATVGLVTGVLAKEVVVGTLNTLYSDGATSAAPVSIANGLKEAVMSIPNNLKDLKSAFLNPVLASASMTTLSNGVMGKMVHYFDGPIGAFAYLLFILLYVPCVSTVAVISRELGSRWAWFSATWSIGVAYVLSVLFYQTATLFRHPLASLTWWIVIMALVILVLIPNLKKYSNEG